MISAAGLESTGRRRQSPPPGEDFGAVTGIVRLSVSRSGWRLAGEANSISNFGWSAGLDNGAEGERRVFERGGLAKCSRFSVRKGKQEGSRATERGKWSNRLESSTVRLDIKIGATFCGLR